MEISGKKIVILGAARSGLAAAKLALQLKAHPKISDRNPADKISEDQTWIKKNNVPFQTGGHTRDFIQDSDLVVISPGVRIDAEPVRWAKEKNIPAMGEIEFASRFCKSPIIAVTGSNGKTTTSTLIKEILIGAGRKACLCGNVGTPFSEFVLTEPAPDFFVLEISSFQLESIEHFRPHIAVFLNFNQNHLDRHKDMQEYFEAKKRIFENQTKEDFAVLNARDPWAKKISPKSQVRLFNQADQPGAPFKNPNQAAVAAVAGILDIDLGVCRKVFERFKGVEHRLELVRTIDGVDYINDSKATTAEAGRWAMENIEKPIIMICGGRDKHIDFSVLEDIVYKKVKKMFIVGESREKIKKSFEKIIRVELCDRLEAAVQKAKECAHPGDCVLLSPMCTSFDMFKNFEERGRNFKEIVKKL